MIRMGTFPPIVRPDGVVTGLAGLGLNLYFLGWALRRLGKGESPREDTGPGV